MKHIDLTDKEVAGVIDHANNSITSQKLASDIDASDINFHATYVRHMWFMGRFAFHWYLLYPGQEAISFIDLPLDRAYFAELGGYLEESEPPGALIIAGLAYTGSGYPRAWIKNIGTAKLKNTEAGFSSMEWKP